MYNLKVLKRSEGGEDVETLRDEIANLLPVQPVRARNEKGDLIVLDVKAGDTVLFGKWSGTEVKIDGEDLLIMKESDIMGIV